MTPEQESQLLQDIGALKANTEAYHSDTKKALNLITGNGRPQDGILYIMTDLRRLHEKCPVITGELPARVAALETADAVHEAKAPTAKKTLKDIVADIFSNPVVERAIIIIITGILFTVAGWFGFSPKDKGHHERPTPVIEATP
jgi:hypothetical protein